MSSLKQILFAVYNLIFIAISAMVIAATLGWEIPQNYISLALATPQNRIAVGLVATVILIGAVLILLSGLKPETAPESMVVESSLAGQVSITVAAIETIIMKAVRKVEGVKEIRPLVTGNPQGLVVCLHMRINPEFSVPEMSKNIQSVVKQHLEDIGGLQVAEIKILVDDGSAFENKSRN